jgi:hypothetical protein
MFLAPPIGCATCSTGILLTPGKAQCARWRGPVCRRRLRASPVVSAPDRRAETAATWNRTRLRSCGARTEQTPSQRVFRSTEARILADPAGRKSGRTCLPDVEHRTVSGAPTRMPGRETMRMLVAVRVRRTSCSTPATAHPRGTFPSEDVRQVRELDGLTRLRVTNGDDHSETCSVRPVARNEKPPSPLRRWEGSLSPWETLFSLAHRMAHDRQSPCKYELS